jgi:addiction module RelB/DinJ family antitoxin
MAILRTRIDPRRKARVEKILGQLGVTPTQAVNMFFAEIERRKAIPFPVAIGDTATSCFRLSTLAKCGAASTKRTFRTWTSDEPGKVRSVVAVFWKTEGFCVQVGGRISSISAGVIAGFAPCRT